MASGAPVSAHMIRLCFSLGVHVARVFIIRALPALQVGVEIRASSFRETSIQRLSREQDYVARASRQHGLGCRGQTCLVPRSHVRTPGILPGQWDELPRRNPGKHNLPGHMTMNLCIVLALFCHGTWPKQQICWCFWLFGKVDPWDFKAPNNRASSSQSLPHPSRTHRTRGNLPPA